MWIPGESVRVVNPDPPEGQTGVVCEDAEVAEVPDYAALCEDVVWVWLRPSVREGMDADLGTYPSTWIRHRDRS